MRNKMFFLILVFLQFRNAKSQDIDLNLDSIRIKIMIRYKEGTVSQLWHIANNNARPIYIPISKTSYRTPIHEVLKSGEAIFVATGQAILFQGIPLETPVLLTSLSPRDSIQFEVKMIDKNTLEKISFSEYIKLPKAISIDYITDEDIKEISNVGVAYKSVFATDYISKVRFIHFKYLNSCPIVDSVPK